MVKMSLEITINLIMISSYLISASLYTWLSYRILSRVDEKTYLEFSFSSGLFAAAIGNVLSAIFRFPYVLIPGGFGAWRIGSFLYFASMSVALSFILIAGLSIKTGYAGFGAGFFVAGFGTVFFFTGFGTVFFFTGFEATSSFFFSF